MLDVAPDLRDVVCLGVIRADGVVVRGEAPDVWAEMDRVAADLRARHGGKAPADIPELQSARELYRRTGVDPTKVRPSSEALLRRVLRGDPLYRINSLVDAINLCSLEFLLPIGLYDADRIVGPVTVRRGQAGEAYESLGKGLFSVAGRLALFDSRGPFGGPTNDSRRTAITEQTTRCLVVIFAPGSYPAGRMGGHVQHATRRLREFAQAARVESAVVGGR
ncbi:MAG: phenylalanine--tRNA ligase beta subunit-related protein [Armatimonadota bacterium]|nr:phenylalanine--tRNA ligase beta subunit-related protein [Armatimonadota bacterium]MDR7403209.1 phenylalanine--tRNA ligase beta subunit-related protein [Armatimonadota bacterium]MDR7515953.1 phenylalanine--tRNA ligase beta subunit-related protein [Armatimonadota bacterium]MDR7561833.1 phenylalanine--tRNA ligase beta subunit-related protein [Armatimonadota bacterium]MDR7587021.1 phenylalanine--tRNA ligase beta subunit-related protein [Armatimonadota bacterium]